MKLYFCHLAIVAFVFSTQPCWSQCETPQQNMAAPVQKDLDRIFKTVLQQNQALEAFQSNESMIEPGSRVGNYHLGTSKEEIESSAQLKKFETKSNPEYEYFLPIGYIPKRIFSEHPKQKITFAFFTNDQTLKEIFVRDGEYRTTSGLKIGVSLLSVKNIIQGTQRTIKGKTYLVADGITFVFEKDVLTEMIVMASKTKVKSP